MADRRRHGLAGTRRRGLKPALRTGRFRFLSSPPGRGRIPFKRLIARSTVLRFLYRSSRTAATIGTQVELGREPTARAAQALTSGTTSTRRATRLCQGVSS
jgi:hypothetical protein